MAKKKQVKFISNAARRALSLPDRTIQLVGTGGSPIFERDPSVLIAFQDGVYRVPQGELGKRIEKFIKDQPDFGGPNEPLGSVNSNGKIVSIVEYREPTEAEKRAAEKKRKSQEQRLAEAEAKAEALEKELATLKGTEELEPA